MKKFLQTEKSKLKQGCYKLIKYLCKDMYNNTEDFYFKYMWLFQTLKFTK